MIFYGHHGHIRLVFSHILHCLIVEEPSEEPGLPVENSLLEEQQPGALCILCPHCLYRWYKYFYEYKQWSDSTISVTFRIGLPLLRTIFLYVFLYVFLKFRMDISTIF